MERYKVSTRYLRVNPFALYGWNQIFGEDLSIPPDEVLAVYYRNNKNSNTFYPYPNGGKTIVTVRDTQTGYKFVGVATCSMKDQFSYKVGKEIALKRAEESKRVLD